MVEPDRRAGQAADVLGVEFDDVGAGLLDVRGRRQTPLLALGIVIELGRDGGPSESRKFRTGRLTRRRGIRTILVRHRPIPLR